MRTYLIIITRHDGTRCSCSGLFASDWDAIESMSSQYHDARAIAPRRLS